MRDFNAEWKRLEKAQRVLNVAWISGGLGMVSTLLGMGLRIPPIIIAPWLALCALVAFCALILSVVVSFSPLE